MSHKSTLFVILSLLMVLMLSACQSATSGNNEAAQNYSVETQGEKVSNVTDDLPQDFPLPEDAKLGTTHSETKDGKKSVMLIFTTKEDMATIISLYKEYFKTQGLDDSDMTIDDRNIIIQGDNMEKKESWSLIGGPLTEPEGVIELTLTWMEL